MSRRLLIDIAQLTPAQREALASEAAARGFEAVFADGGALCDAEIYLGANPAIFDAAPGLRWMSASFAGVDQYLEPAARRNVALTSSSGAYGVTISEHVIMVTLMMLRRQPEYAEIMRRRGWERNLAIRSIRGSRVTLLGAGDIGRETALRLRAFEPKSIVAVNRSGRAAEGAFDAVCPLSGLDALLPDTDLLVMSLPATPETRRLMDARRLKLMSPDAYIVNVGRGSTLDQQALAELMREGRFAGAALDVFEQEPLPADDPLWDCPRVLITSHVAGNMTLPYTVSRIVEMFLQNFGRYCEGQPLLRAVDPGRGY